MASGRIIRFNAAKGYGFIEQDGGGADVFIHAEELRGLDAVATTGSRLQFNVLDGGRGLKACDVVVLTDPAPTGAPSPRPAADDPADFDVFDVVSRATYAQEITEALIGATPNVTAGQILQVRQHLIDAAYSRGWLDD